MTQKLDNHIGHDVNNKNTNISLLTLEEICKTVSNRVKGSIDTLRGAFETFENNILTFVTNEKIIQSESFLKKSKELFLDEVDTHIEDFRNAIVSIEIELGNPEISPVLREVMATTTHRLRGVLSTIFYEDTYGYTFKKTLSTIDQNTTSLHDTIQASMKNQSIPKKLYFDAISLQDLIKKDMDIAKFFNNKLNLRIRKIKLPDSLQISNHLKKCIIKGGYPILTSECILELINNAVTATLDCNNPSIHISLDIITDNIIEIKITDNGNGIIKENLDSIFQEGFTTKEHGTGFGLHFVQSYVEGVLGGKITVESIEGQGTTFTLHIPKQKDTTDC